MSGPTAGRDRLRAAAQRRRRRPARPATPVDCGSMTSKWSTPSSSRSVHVRVVPGPVAVAPPGPAGRRCRAGRPPRACRPPSTAGPRGPPRRTPAGGCPGSHPSGRRLRRRRGRGGRRRAGRPPGPAPPPGRARRRRRRAAAPGALRPSAPARPAARRDTSSPRPASSPGAAVTAARTSAYVVGQPPARSPTAPVRRYSGVTTSQPSDAQRLGERAGVPPVPLGPPVAAVHQEQQPAGAPGRDVHVEQAVTVGGVPHDGVGQRRVARVRTSVTRPSCPGRTRQRVA